MGRDINACVLVPKFALRYADVRCSNPRRRYGAFACAITPRSYSAIVANFAAYTFAPPIMVTPLGCLSVLIGCVTVQHHNPLKVY